MSREGRERLQVGRGELPNLPRLLSGSSGLGGTPLVTSQPQSQAQVLRGLLSLGECAACHPQNPTAVSVQGGLPYHLGSGMYLFFQALCFPDKRHRTLEADLPRGRAAK